MLYSEIKRNSLVFEDLHPETKYQFKIRAVNNDGYSDWVTLEENTASDPLEFALKGITARTTAKNQGGQGADKLFDFDEGNMWHTDWSNANAVPFDMIFDLHSVSQLDKLEYLPRDTGFNGMLLKGNVLVSMDGKNWQPSGEFEWTHDHTVKTFVFNEKPTARYVKIEVTNAVGGYGSGRELYIFKVPNSESYLPGDINNDKVLDMNDLTSYLNYTGLRKIDADFEYVSKGDLNQNGLIDAYDISAVATKVQGGAGNEPIQPLSGNLDIKADKKQYKNGETVTITVKGNELHSVNALSFALPYSTQDYEFVGIENVGLASMENMTNNRRHSDGSQALYPTFVNLGEKASAEGSKTLFVIKLKAKKSIIFNLKPTDIILVDKQMNSISP
ncbi:MAG: discoidin domain-containing protein [Myroides sp.]|nr:discoidin domain-containing protein [Myroides sp.]